MDGDDVVLVAVESPDRDVFKAGSFQRITPATDRGDGGEAVGEFVCQRPGAVPAHAQTGDVDPIGVDAILGLGLIEQCGQFMRGPPSALRALRGDDDERKRLALGRVVFEHVRDAAGFDHIQAVAALAFAV